VCYLEHKVDFIYETENPDMDHSSYSLNPQRLSSNRLQFPERLAAPGPYIYKIKHNTFGAESLASGNPKASMLPTIPRYKAIWAKDRVSQSSDRRCIMSSTSPEVHHPSSALFHCSPVIDVKLPQQQLYCEEA
jgi:hypothetical protein